jgi:hypothetical protein
MSARGAKKGGRAREGGKSCFGTKEKQLLSIIWLSEALQKIELKLEGDDISMEAIAWV